MTSTYFPQARADRAICLGRVLLAVFTLLALWLDADIADVHRTALGVVAGVFLAYSVGSLLLVWNSRMPRRVRLLLHGCDFAVFTVCVIWTRGAVSGFFAFFVFSVFGAMLRFGRVATVLTALASGLVYLTTTLVQNGFTGNEGLITVRLASILVITMLLLTVHHYHQRVNEELTALAEWPEPSEPERQLVALEMVRAACGLLRAERAVLMWDEGEEPWLYVASFDGRQASFSREGPSATPMIAPGDANAYYVRDTGAGEEVVGFGERVTRARSAVIDPQLRVRFGFRSAVVAALTGEIVEGHLLFLDTAEPSHDDLALAQIAARLIAVRLDQVHASERSQLSAVDDERVRVARDLHDGVLQSLTGVSLQLESLRSAVDVNDPVHERLRNVQEIIAAEQRELRTFIGQLRPQPAVREVSLEKRLTTMAERFSRQWDLRVRIDIDPPSPIVSERLAAEVFNIVSESVANAAKHANASEIHVAVAFGDSIVRIFAEDDGNGFPFTGTFDLFELEQQKRGPVNLKSRVASLGGRMTLNSSEQGAAIEITLPA